MLLKKNLSRYFYFLIIFSVFGLVNSSAQTKAKLTKRTSNPAAVSKTEREKIESIIREYLLSNPKLIREVLQELQVREEQEKVQMAAASLKTFKLEIYQDATSPVGGNVNGDVSIVVFYDYDCGYCRKSLPDLQNLVAKDLSLRVIYKEMPILTPQSHFAALAALAANRQGKFAQFHHALLTSDNATDEKAIKEIAVRVGLNWETLQNDMSDPKLNAAIDNNIKLANSLNINGTPAYLVGDQIIPGAIDSASLEKLIATQRAKSRPATDDKNNVASSTER